MTSIVSVVIFVTSEVVSNGFNELSQDVSLKVDDTARKDENSRQVFDKQGLLIVEVFASFPDDLQQRVFRHDGFKRKDLLV